MDLHDYLDALRRHWRFFVVCVLLGLAGATAVTVLMPRSYTADAQLFVATRDESSGAAYQGGLFTQQRVKSYTRIVTSPAVLDGVIAELGLPTTSDHLAKKINATAPLDTTLVDIKVTDRSPVRAQAIADATAVHLTQYIATVEGGTKGSPPLVKASVVGGSQPPSTPTSPRPGLNLAIGLVAGTVVGVSGAVLRQSLDTTLHTADDISAQLSLPVLGTVPPPDGRRRAKAAVPRLGTTRHSEALSRLRTRLSFTPGGGMPASVLIGSALPAEGRTTTAVDLATSVARTGRRVVLLEADLRGPCLAERLDLRGPVGLTDVLTGRTSLCDALQNSGDGHLRVLTSGFAPADPSVLLSSPAMARLIRALEGEADLVVVDSPPLLSFAEGATLASLTAGALLLVRAGRTRLADAHRALDTLSAVRARVLGAVLTDASTEKITDWQPPSPPLRPNGVLRPQERAEATNRTAVQVPDRHQK
ncbi:Wzz/FepE/Etk N-terminal domain-containing protein [Streptomyces sp. NPDC048324]|uniref:Wzz/FepE/Etk N-terminal domain-containing protein n=1 Tax=Streptomyces sp. NPDC048324 TaxID=3157205 RepID=UPI0034173B6D